MRDEAAEIVVKNLIGRKEDEIKSFMLSVVFGCVDFRNNAGGNVSRSERLLWWIELIENVGPFKIKFDVEIKNLDDAIRWLERQVAPTFAMVGLHLKDAFRGFTEYLRIVGEQRLNEKHYEMLNRVNEERK